MRGLSALIGLAAVLAAVSAWWLMHAEAANQGSDPDHGARVFATEFTPAQGLGPLFNAASCTGCHNTPAPGGTGPNGLATVLRIGRFTSAGFDPLVGKGGPIARAHSIGELGVSCSLRPGIPTEANVTSVRNAPALFGDGQIDAIPEEAILAGAVPRADGIAGRPNLVGGHVGRFGWKGDTPGLSQFVSEAFRNELGLTNRLAPLDLVLSGSCGSEASTPKLASSSIADVVAYIAALPVPAPRGDPTVFQRIGCAECHLPNLSGVPLYSDLLLHDMGRALDDGIVQAGATGRHWRTAPLWGLSQRSRFLHDGRARSVDAAIMAHDGEASQVVQRYRNLPAVDSAALLAFLHSL